MKKLFASFAIAGTLLTTGCATVAPMSPTTATNSVDTSKNSYALMTVTLKNAYHTSYQRVGQAESDRMVGQSLKPLPDR
jgi:uncharacterized protein YceK